MISMLPPPRSMWKRGLAVRDRVRAARPMRRPSSVPESRRTFFFRIRDAGIRKEAEFLAWRKVPVATAIVLWG